jgi:hypothetical protein
MSQFTPKSDYWMIDGKLIPVDSHDGEAFEILIGYSAFERAMMDDDEGREIMERGLGPLDLVEEQIVPKPIGLALVHGDADLWQDITASVSLALMKHRDAIRISADDNVEMWNLDRKNLGLIQAFIADTIVNVRALAAQKPQPVFCLDEHAKNRSRCVLLTEFLQIAKPSEFWRLAEQSIYTTNPTGRDLSLAAVDEAGVHFETGQPVEFLYVRGTKPAPNYGARFQQDIEPAGRYMVHVPGGLQIQGKARMDYEQGLQRFANPLVLAFTLDPDELYGQTSWKARLSGAFKAKGKALSRKLAAAGYDGIVTVWLVRGVGSHTKEIVDLTMFTHKQNPVDPIRDESFEWVHPAVRGEIDAAVDRALGSGATPPLSYAGAGQYGIVICDSKGKAYKVARGWGEGQSTVRSLREEEAWFRFASQIPTLRDHVAKVYGFDEANGVLVRECVQAVENRRSDWTGKRDQRRTDLFNRMTQTMRQYGFRSPEYKEDAFVYHPKRGPVLVDAGFGARDIGWSNARRAQALLKGARPQNEWETGSVVHGLRMDAGDEVPADIANKLADRLEATYMQNPQAGKPRLRIAALTYRGHQGFSVTGTDEYGHRIRVFAKTRKGAEAIRSAYKDIVDRDDRFAEVNRILLAAKDNPVRTPSYSYHVTFYNRLETIANRWLVPVESMRPGAS